MIKTGMMILWYGIKMTAMILGVVALVLSPFLVAAAIGYLVQGQNGALAAAMGVVILVLIALIGILAGAEWDYAGRFRRWKWESGEG